MDTPALIICGTTAPKPRAASDLVPPVKTSGAGMAGSGREAWQNVLLDLPSSPVPIDKSTLPGASHDSNAVPGMTRLGRDSAGQAKSQREM